MKSFKNIAMIAPSVDKQDPLYVKLVLVNIILSASALLFFMFGLYYIFIQSLYIIGLIELLAFIFILYTLYRIRYESNIELTTTIIVSTIFFVLISLVILKKAEHFTLIWTIFVPIASIFIYGTAKGLKLCIAFYSVVFVLAYQGVDIWQDGAWNMASYTRYVLASILLILMIYVLELSLEKSYTALEEKRKQEKSYIEQLKHYSITDPLTQLHNRRYLDQIFSENFQVAAKSNSLYVFIIIDLDYFKNYNDTYGHKAGDDVLVKISKILTDNMRRDSDYAFRIGGEEFACLIISRNKEDVFTLLERIRQDMEDTKLITASFGVCIIDKFDYENFDEMYKSADEFLYEAKEKGRNQVVGGLISLKKNIQSDS